MGIDYVKYLLEIHCYAEEREEKYGLKIVYSMAANASTRKANTVVFLFSFLK